MFSRDLTIAKYDADLFAAMEQEAVRQEEHIELIASENYTSPAVMEAQGSVLTNKYAEGYPGKRYYGGCEYVDVVEQLAIDRAKELFGADYANVQPHAGSQANSAVYLALLQGGDTILGNERCEVIGARGPFLIEDERALFERRQIDVLISKNSGSSATEPKLEVARERGVPVLVLKRPVLPEVDREFTTVNSVLQALQSL